MNTQETIANNRLIAEFMGAKRDEELSFGIRPNEVWLPYHGICRADTVEVGRGKTLRYHNDWNWLMPVVEKIEEGTKHGFTIYRKTVNINGLPLEISNMRAGTKILAVYHAVIAFIKWHNENKEA